MGDEVVSNLKPDPEPCACGCGLTGSPKKNGHIKRLCRCLSCRNGGNARRGKGSQREFQKIAKIRPARFRAMNGNEEAWRDYFRWEHKDGAQVRPVVTAYKRCVGQIDRSNSIGDTRPRAVGVSCDGVRLVIVSAEDWGAHVAPRLNDEDGAA